MLIPTQESKSAFLALDFDARPPLRKRQLCDVMPRGKLCRYLAVITEAYDSSSGDEPMSDFDTLFGHQNRQVTAEGLCSIRKSGAIYEGRKLLSVGVVAALMSDSTSDYVHVRSGQSGNVWIVAKGEYLSADVLEAIPEDYGEFEVTDENNSWYFRMRDDDPLVFVASTDSLCEKLINLTPCVAIELESQFQYA